MTDDEKLKIWYDLRDKWATVLVKLEKIKQALKKGVSYGQSESKHDNHS